MTVMLEAPTTTPEFVAAITAQACPAGTASYDDYRDLITDEIAIALAVSDIATLPEHLLTEMSTHPEVIEVETLPPVRPELARMLVGWVAQGVERLGGRHALWVAEYTSRFMESQGYPSWENNTVWGGLSRARMANMLSWGFHPWAGGQEPEIEHVHLWELTERQGEVRRTRQLRDLRGIERERPYLKLVRWADGYRWAPAS